MDTIGRRLKRLRAQSEYTQDQVAVSLRRFGVNVDRGTVARWETDVQVPTIRPVAALAHLFDVTMDYIAEGEDHVNCSKRCLESVPNWGGGEGDIHCEELYDLCTKLDRNDRNRMIGYVKALLEDVKYKKKSVKDIAG
jgi:transcriptional regulator with XRE-family HTH domain